MAFTSCIGRPLAACTIISRNYLSHACVLAQSFLEHEPGGRFYLLVIDPLPEGLDLDGRIRLIRPEDLALPFYADMTFRYGVTELSTAVKPTFLRLLLHRHGEDPVVYFDPDILVTAPLDALRQALGSAGIVLTPHLLAPIPQDGREPTESSILIAGAYNLGFVGLRAATETEAFLLWWEERLRDACVVDLPRGLMVDQKWVDLVPGIFPSTGMLRDPTYNVAYWNIHARPLEERGGRFLVHGRPLTFFHFSGFNPAKPQVLSKEQNRTAVVPGTALAKLVDRYVQLHRENGFDKYSRLSYGYGRFDNGAAITEPIRRVYRELDEASRARFGNPFKAGEPGTLFAWATRPRRDEGRFSPFLESVYRSRPDVMEEWPDVYGRNREAFLTWALERGPKELGTTQRSCGFGTIYPRPPSPRTRAQTQSESTRWPPTDVSRRSLESGPFGPSSRPALTRSAPPGSRGGGSSGRTVRPPPDLTRSSRATGARSNSWLTATRNSGPCSSMRTTNCCAATRSCSGRWRNRDRGAPLPLRARRRRPRPGAGR